MTIGERIKEARRGKDLSQLELALRLEISQGAVGQYERDIILPALSQVVGLARELQVSTDWLLGAESATLTEVLRARTKLSELAFLRRLTEALENGKLNGTQIGLLDELVGEFIKTSKL